MWLCVCVSFSEPKPGVSTETRRVAGLGSAGDLGYRNIQEPPVSPNLPVASLLLLILNSFSFSVVSSGRFCSCGDLPALWKWRIMP